MLSIAPKRDLLMQDTPEAVPIGEVRPVVGGEGLGAQLAALAKYMVRTEVHTYAFSVAANVILSLFPFIVMLLTISRQVFHSQAMVGVVREMMTSFLPSNQDFIMRNMVLLATPHKSTQVYSVIMLLISSTGVFLPLEVALNGVWGVKENRSYLKNQVTSLGLALLIGTLAMVSVGFTTAQSWIFLGHTGSFAYVMLHGGTATMLGVTSSVLIFFLIYWILPNRKVPARAVLPTAIVIGLLWEGAKVLYVWTLPHLDFPSVYGPFGVSVGLMIWAFLSGLLLLAGAHFSATRYALAAARKDEREDKNEAEKKLNAEVG
jgi:YihY family inner membrane protein